METSNAIIPSEAVVEVLTELIGAIRYDYAYAQHTAGIAQRATDEKTIDIWNTMSAKFTERADIRVAMATALAKKHGIDYMQFSNAVPL